MRGQAHSDEIRAEVIAALLTGLGVNEVARQYKLPKASVSRIKKELAPERLEQVGTENRARIDDLLVTALSANLRAQRRILDTASEPSYIRSQPAASVAELFGEIADRAIRLLEAASLAGVDPGQESDDAAGGRVA